MLHFHFLPAHYLPQVLNPQTRIYPAWQSGWGISTLSIPQQAISHIGAIKSSCFTVWQSASAASFQAA